MCAQRKKEQGTAEIVCFTVLKIICYFLDLLCTLALMCFNMSARSAQVVIWLFWPSWLLRLAYLTASVLLAASANQAVSHSKVLTLTG